MFTSVVLGTHGGEEIGGGQNFGNNEKINHFDIREWYSTKHSGTFQKRALASSPAIITSQSLMQKPCALLINPNRIASKYAALAQLTHILGLRHPYAALVFL